MKHAVRRALAFVIATSALSLAGCGADATSSTDSSASGPDAPGKIYYRVQQNFGGSGTSPCDHTTHDYRDDNPAVPDDPFAHMTAYAGPSEPGTYHAEYYFSDFGPLIGFTYTLVRPATGQKRMYTRLLKTFSYTLNRCVDVSKDPAYLTYVDLPQ